MAIKLIIGLRNPGLDYEKTRHNAGAWFVSALAQGYHSAFKLDRKMQAQLGNLELGQQICRLALPTTFMNHSGQALRAVSQFYGILPEEILVAHDELDLPVGCARLKIGGGHGGHNGLRDITTSLGSPLFNRLRIGIGHPGHRDLVHDYVLGKPSLHDTQQIDEAIARAIAAMPLLLKDGLPAAMNQLNAL
ncbi:MAG: aminoacyl-tRNA hydrolase [Legionella sp.]|nr:aminoacyl-tRNA hydrolase [Legionella sp.]